MNRRLARLIAFAEVLEREVELLEVLALRGWSKHVVFNKAVEALDATLFVALRRSGELHFERQATAERSKRLVLFAVAATQDARDRRLGVIEEPDARNAAEVHDGAQNAGEERHLVFAQRHAREEPPAVAEPRDKQMYH